MAGAIEESYALGGAREQVTGRSASRGKPESGLAAIQPTAVTGSIATATLVCNSGKDPT